MQLSDELGWTAQAEPLSLLGTMAVSRALRTSPSRYGWCYRDNDGRAVIEPKKKNSFTMSRSSCTLEAPFIRIRRCDPQSMPFEYQADNARSLLITHRSRPRARGGSSMPG